MTAKIKLNSASGGGSVSIQAPSSMSNNRVITLPDLADGDLVTSQSTLDATKLSGALPAISGANLTGLAAGGKLLQLVHFQTTQQFSTSSSTFVDVTNFSTSIVPQTNSKVLVQVTLMSLMTSSVSGGEGFGIKILRGSTSVLTSGGMYDIYDNAQGVSGAHSRNRSTWTVLDSSPGGDGSTTLTYKIQVGSHGNGNTIQITEGNMTSSMTLFEIGA